MIFNRQHSAYRQFSVLRFTLFLLVARIIWISELVVIIIIYTRSSYQTFEALPWEKVQVPLFWQNRVIRGNV